MQIQRPWQAHPTELVSHALDHLHRPTDFDQRIAFLLLDVGVETVLKTYLLLPADVINRSKPGFTNRKEAAHSESFIDVLAKAWETADDDLRHIDRYDVLYYHNIRNKLYHQGDGVVVTAQNANAYATLAVELLNRLLGVDLTDQLMRPQREMQQRQERAERIEQVRKAQARIDQASSAIGSVARVALEKIDLECLLPSWEKQVQDSFLAYLGHREEWRWDGSLALSTDSQQQQWFWGSVLVDPIMQQHLYRVCEELDLSTLDLDIVCYPEIAHMIASRDPEGDLFPWVDHEHDKDPLAKFLGVCEETIADLERIRAAIAEGVSQLVGHLPQT